MRYEAGNGETINADEILQIEAFKRDLIGVDQICITVFCTDGIGRTWTEDNSDWAEINRWFQSQLEGYAEQDPYDVAFPPFEECRTILYPAHLIGTEEFFRTKRASLFSRLIDAFKRRPKP